MLEIFEHFAVVIFEILAGLAGFKSLFDELFVFFDAVFHIAIITLFEEIMVLAMVFFARFMYN